MNDSREYVITLRGEFNSDNAGANSAFAGNTQASASNSAKGNAGASIQKKDLMFLGAWHTVKSFGVQQVNHEVSLVELRTGSRDLQEHANFYNNLIQTGASIIESTAVGAITGNLPGAIIGFTLSASHKVLSLANANKRLMVERNVESRSLESLYIRAGAQGSRGRNQ